jgi:chaperonin GroES
MGIMDGEFPMPYSNRVIVLADPHPERIGGIIIPETAKEKVLVGTVIAAGDGKYYGDKFVSNEVKAGDRVLYGQYSGGYDGFKIDGVKHLSMRDEDIIMVLED